MDTFGSVEYTGKTSYWRFDDDLENPTYHLEWQKLWQDTYTKMLKAENDVAKGAVIQYLRDQGYTVTPPEEE